MLLFIFDYDTKEGIAIPEKIRSNTSDKKIIEKVKEMLQKQYGARITRLLPTGKIDFATGNSDIHYIIFGENLEMLPTRKIIFRKVF